MLLCILALQEHPSLNDHPPGMYCSLLDQLLSKVTRGVGHDVPKIDNEWHQTMNGTHQIPIQTVLPNTQRV